MTLLRWALVFLIVSMIAALFGFGNIAEGTADIAKVLCFLFVGVCVIFFLMSAVAVRSVAGPSDPDPRTI